MTPKRKKAPAGAFLRSSLMHFYSGAPMHFLSGVDNGSFGVVDAARFVAASAVPITRRIAKAVIRIDRIVPTD